MAERLPSLQGQHARSNRLRAERAEAKNKSCSRKNLMRKLRGRFDAAVGDIVQGRDPPATSWKPCDHLTRPAEETTALSDGGGCRPRASSKFRSVASRRRRYSVPLRMIRRKSRSRTGSRRCRSIMLKLTDARINERSEGRASELRRGQPPPEPSQHTNLLPERPIEASRAERVRAGLRRFPP